MKGDFSRDTFVKEKHYSAVLMQQGRVQLDADWNEQQAIHRHHLEIECRDVIGRCGYPIEKNTGFEITSANDDNGRPILKIGEGRYYVDGILCENDKDCYYRIKPDSSKYPPQPDLPDADQALDESQIGLVYLDVWDRHITALDDPHIREKALGGPDTSTRIKTVWQVKMLKIQGNFDNLNCDINPADWEKLIVKRKPEMKALVELPTVETPCYIPPKSKYFGSENQLYRVEIHKGGTRQEASFKWSRNNGSIMTGIEKIDDKKVTVSDIGKDDVLCFSSGHWVEISDDELELKGKLGQLALIKSVDKVTHEITVKDTINLNFDKNNHPKLRLWDQVGDYENGIQMTGDYQDLENGIRVCFSEGEYETGDYWTIPARTATGDIEWPIDDSGKPDAKQRSGIYHHYCKLALAKLEHNGYIIKNCRKKFLPLTELESEEKDEAVQIEAVHFSNGNRIRNDFHVNLNELLEQKIIIEFNQKINDVISKYSQERKPNPICTLTIDVPIPKFSSSPYSYQPFILAANITAINEKIFWNIFEENRKDILDWLNPIIQESKMGLLAHLTLKGNFIWEYGLPNINLDGDAFGIRSEDEIIDLQLPSGDGKRGGNFEMWFWIDEYIEHPIG